MMRLLAENTTVDTGYGGQFVSGIDGLRSTFGSVSSADAADWFYWVDGVMADVGATRAPSAAPAAPPGCSRHSHPRPV